ncbi:hypothetical protein VHEMI00342 [[Torrubiella] hemipterigena]|uniref:Major facilitator superfamily (MFS) profile domain-containing protein n=1 Tax=[Torrubiella] hemipterigena TaxID=1531966 RepID=A0A0A1T1R0_9HYPO|nr:hypothetical protein VHEMI00342 [[Torrubiella] hemipterigena]
MLCSLTQPEMAQVGAIHDASPPPAPRQTTFDEEQIQIQHAVRSMNGAYDWMGPDDKDNPRNFSLAFRIYSTVAITFIAMVGTVSGAMYAPAKDDVAATFNCSHELAIVPLSLYNLGLAFGPLVGAPLSETYGRKAVLLVSGLVFMLFSIGAGFAQSLTALTVCRFFAGMFAAPLINNAPATMLDFTPGRYRGVSLSVYYTIPSVGAALGPLLGGFIVPAGGWRWTQWASVLFAAAAYIPILFTRETYKKIILRRRALRLGLVDSASQLTSASRVFRYFATTLIQRPLHMLFTEPIVTLVSLYCGFLYGLLYTFVVSVPWIFSNYYGFTGTGTSLAYLGMIGGTIIASIPLVAIDMKFYQPRLARWQAQNGDEVALPCESRLIGALVGSIMLPLSLFAVGWTAQYQVNPVVPIFCQGLVMLSSLLIYASTNLFMLDSYGPLYGASASGALMLSRYILSAAFPLFALQMFMALGAGWASSLLGFITVIMAPIPWCFWMWGDKLRKRSKYETSS